MNYENSEFLGINVYKNKQRLDISIGKDQKIIKVGGLDIEKEYDISLMIKTTAGILESNDLRLKTSSREDMSGIWVSFGELKEIDGNVDDELIEMIEGFGGKCIELNDPDTTHFVCDYGKGEDYEKALEMNIPIVSSDFIRDCVKQGKIQNSSQYYVKRSTTAMTV